jgi:hypothetical protein
MHRSPGVDVQREDGTTGDRPLMAASPGESLNCRSCGLDAERDLADQVRPEAVPQALEDLAPVVPHDFR